MKLPDINKISVAPHFFNYTEYFQDFNKFFKTWKSAQIAQVEKKYGKECMRRIQNDEIPLDEKYEKRMNRTLKGSDLKEWREKELKCFLAYVDLNDLSVKQKAFYDSFLIFIFSDFENILDDICNKYSLKTKQKILLKDIAGRGVERAINYLDKVAMFTLPSTHLNEEVFLMRDLRNCLAHAGGKINSTDLLNKIKRSKLLEILNDDYSNEKSIFFDERYCKHAIKIISKFIIELVKKNNDFLWHWSV